MLRHLIIGPGPCNFKILKYRLFLESICMAKTELGLCRGIVTADVLAEGLSRGAIATGLA